MEEYLERSRGRKKALVLKIMRMNCTGGGIFGGKTGLVFSLCTFATVFQAKVFVIMAAIRESITRGYNGRTITIFTDSQAALKALESVTEV